MSYKSVTLTLTRVAYKELDCMLGKLTINNRLICHTLEPSPYDTHPCIPLGTYRVKVYNSPKFKRKVLRLYGVPGRSAIEIHPGNYACDTKGCILPGYFSEVFKGKVSLKDSTFCLMRLLDFVDGSSQVFIEVKESSSISSFVHSLDTPLSSVLF